MNKQEIALQLTLKILETTGIGIDCKYDINNSELEKYTKMQSKLISTIFNDLVEQLNCD